MQLRGFIGLFFLFAILLIVGSPVLLGMASNGVDTGLTLAGMPSKEILEQEKLDEYRAGLDEDDIVTGPTIVRGWEYRDDDIVDTLPVGERDMTLAENEPPPFRSEKGVLRDSEMCPLVPGDVNMRLALKDAKIAKLYAGKVADAAEAGNGSCAATWNDRVRASTVLPDEEEPSAAATLTADRAERDARIETEIAKQLGERADVVLGVESAASDIEVAE